MDVVLAPQTLSAFIERVMSEGGSRYRDFAWRRTTDPYAVLVSEVMLQQTQVSRVERYYERWMSRFPHIDAVAAASTGDVLELWQGLGYNRRALMLMRAAEIISETYAGNVPDTTEELLELPGIGPATAAGIQAFAHNRPSTYLETNVRAVVLFELFADEDEVSDRVVMAVVRDAAELSYERGIDPRDWNYALLDYGAWLKKTVPNPSRRSTHHTRQSTFEGSRRQKRAELLRRVLDGPGRSVADYAHQSGYDEELTEGILADLVREGFLSEVRGRYQVAH